jgi:hypothetical protein
MKKWGTKLEFSGAIILGCLVLGEIMESTYVFLFGGIIGGGLLISSFYDSWKNRQNKK